MFAGARERERASGGVRANVGLPRASVEGELCLSAVNKKPPLDQKPRLLAIRVVEIIAVLAKKASAIGPSRGMAVPRKSR